MKAIADTTTLVEDGVITPDQARQIEARARDTMVSLGINTVLSFGIIAATLGFIAWLADPVAVAVLGVMWLVAGRAVLSGKSGLYAMFGNAAMLIGAGMLIGGAAAELMSNHPDIAGPVMTVGGLIFTALAARIYMNPGHIGRFVLGAILLMGLAFHIAGVAIVLEDHNVRGLIKAMFFLYTAAALAGAGWLTDVRLVTALAIVPFAQMLETGTGYFHAVYVFYSPETTLSILQMIALIGLCYWVAGRWPERQARHAGVLMVMGFIVANLCALVGSLWGDIVGETLWGPGRYNRDLYTNYEGYTVARDAFRETAITLSANLYSVLWAVALVAIILWAAHRNQRGLFNASLTFGGIHAYTQFFESFYDEPLAYIIGGLSAIPLAWGMWRLNAWIVARAEPDVPS